MALPPPGLAFLRGAFPFLSLRPPFLLQPALLVCTPEAARTWECTCIDEGCAPVGSRRGSSRGSWCGRARKLALGGATRGWSKRFAGVKRDLREATKILPPSLPSPSPFSSPRPYSTPKHFLCWLNISLVRPSLLQVSPELTCQVPERVRY